MVIFQLSSTVVYTNIVNNWNNNSKHDEIIDIREEWHAFNALTTFLYRQNMYTEMKFSSQYNFRLLQK